MKIQRRDLGPDDENAIIATADLAERSGARQFEVGYLHDGVPVRKAAWFASAQYAGTRLIVENRRGPVQACRSLANKILTGAKCKCGKLVALSDAGAIAYDKSTHVGGTQWTVEEAAAAGQCRWTLIGRRWEPSCDAPPMEIASR